MQARNSPLYQVTTPSPSDLSSWMHKDGMLYHVIKQLLTWLCLVQGTDSPSYKMDQATPSTPDLSSWMHKDGMLYHEIISY